MQYVAYLICLAIDYHTPYFSRYDIYALNESAKQDEEGIKAAAAKGIIILYTQAVSRVN